MMRASGSRTGAGNRKIAGSLNRLNRKGCTASNRSGPPRFISTTAVRATSGVQRVGQQAGKRLHVFRRCFREYPVAKIEDVRPPAELPADSLHRFFESRPSDE